MDIKRVDTPVQDERGLGRFSPVSDPWGEFELTQSGMDQVLGRMNSIEAMIREQHMATREYMSKGLRESLCIQRSMHEKTCKNLQLAIDGISAIKDKHQADPVLMSGILGLVNSALIYLQTTSPAMAPAIGSVGMGLYRRKGTPVQLRRSSNNSKISEGLWCNINM